MIQYSVQTCQKCLFFHFVLYENSLTALFLKYCKYGCHMVKGEAFQRQPFCQWCLITAMLFRYYAKNYNAVMWFHFNNSIVLLYLHLFFILFCKHFSSSLRNMSPAYYRQWVTIVLCPGSSASLVYWSLWPSIYGFDREGKVTYSATVPPIICYHQYRFCIHI